MNNFGILSHCRLPVVALVSAAVIIAGCSDGDDAPVDDASILTITSPDDGSYENSRTVVVEGEVYEDYDVEVNGESAEVDGEHWEAEVEFRETGSVTATATAGPAEKSVDFTIDTTVPEITLHNPPRGKAIDSDESSGTVTVEGEIGEVGSSGVELVDVNGHSTELDDDNTFETEVTVRPGFNLIEAEVIDRARNSSKTNRAVVFGPLTDPGDSIDEAAHLDVDNPSGIDALEEVIEAYLTPEQVMQFVEGGFDNEDIPVEITDIDWEDFSLDLEPTDGVLEVVVEIEELQIDGAFPFDEESDPLEGDIQIGYVKMELHVDIDAEDDELIVSIVNDVEDDMEVEDITITVDGEERGWLETPAKIAIGIAFSELFEGLIEENLFDPGVLDQEVEFLDRTIEFSLLLQDVIITPSGIRIELGLQFPGEVHEEVDPMPGALNRPVAGSPGTSMAKPFLFHTDRTSMDRLLHGIWETGLFHQTVGNDDLSDVPLPFDLTADGLGSLLDSRIRDIHDTDTPAKLRFRPLLSPVLDFEDDQTGRVRVGDFLIDILLLPEDKPDTETLVVTIALHLDVELEVEIEDNQVGFDIDIDATGDVADEPDLSFDRADTVDLIVDLIEVVPSLMDSELSFDTAETLEWGRFENPEVLTHGQNQERDRVTIGLEVEPAEEYIEDDDVEDPDSDED